PCWTASVAALSCAEASHDLIALSLQSQLSTVRCSYEEALQRPIRLDQRDGPSTQARLLGVEAQHGHDRDACARLPVHARPPAGTLDGAPLLVLHHTGAKSGARRQSPA